MGNAHRPLVAGLGKVPQKTDRRWSHLLLAGVLTQARVKRCGKSAPPDWRQSGHGKPHRVQAQAVPGPDEVGTPVVRRLPLQDRDG